MTKRNVLHRVGLDSCRNKGSIVFLLVCAVSVAWADAGMRAVVCDPLEWLYPDSRIEGAQKLESVDVPSNGVVEANILFNGLAANEPLSFSCDAEGGEWFRLVPVPVEKNTGPKGFIENREKGVTNRYVTRVAPFKVYDALEPLEGRRQLTPDGETVSLRLRLRHFPGCGMLPVRMEFRQGKCATNLMFVANVHGVALPPVGKDSFRYTNWMNWYGAMRCHGVRSYWQDQHFETIRKYMRLAAYGRQNVIPVPLFVKKDAATGRQILDEARYVRFVGMAQDEGFAYLEGPHLCGFGEGGWSGKTFVIHTGTNATVTTTAEGAAQLGRMAAELAAIVERNGWRDIWLQHVADEPSRNNETEYRITAGIVRKYMPGIRLIDAIESPNLAGALDVYCPKNFLYEREASAYSKLRTRPGDEIWCYTCLTPGGKWMNRLLDQEVLRALYLPWGCFVYSLEGYLHWGFNRYEPGKTPFDPGFNGRGPAGDRHLVYPGPDGPWPSVRFEAMRQGVEDCELLRMLRRRDASEAAALAARLVRGFEDYTADVREYRAVRRELLRKLSDEREMK